MYAGWAWPCWLYLAQTNVHTSILLWLGLQSRMLAKDHAGSIAIKLTQKSRINCTTMSPSQTNGSWKPLTQQQDDKKCQHHTTKKYCSIAQSAMKFQLDAIIQISWHPAQTEAGQDCWFGLTCLKCILNLCMSLFWSALFGTALHDVRAGRITPLAQQYQLYYLPNAKFQLNPTDQLWMEDIALSLPWSL